MLIIQLLTEKNKISQIIVINNLCKHKTNKIPIKIIILNLSWTNCHLINLLNRKMEILIKIFGLKNYY